MEAVLRRNPRTFGRQEKIMQRILELNSRYAAKTQADRRTGSKFLSVGLTLFFLFVAVTASAQSSKKFIELGWDIPDTAYLKEHHESMQQTTPFDGIMLALEATAPDGKKVSSQSVTDPTPWEAAWFDTAIADLTACKFTRFTDNFIRFNFSPGTVEWNSDADWKAVCEKTVICSRIAKKAGLKGLAPDFESYGKTMFKFDANTGLSFEETRRLARKRGGEWMKALVSEFPDMVLFTLFVAEVNLQAGQDADPDGLLATAHYGLLPAFFNGMLDEVTPELRIVDGCESGYYLNGFDEFARRALAVQSIGGPAIRLVAPENRQKYIAQVQVGFGFYLDMYVNPEGSKYYRGPKPGGTRLDRLAENLAAAKDATDEYVWLYGEQRRWWAPPKSDSTWENWEQALPGTTRTVRFIKDPDAAAQTLLDEQRAKGPLANILKNADFSQSKSTLKPDVLFPADWNSWQHEPLGTFSWDGSVGNGSVKASRVKWGCVMQSNPVKPGEYYFVSVDAKKQGGGGIGVRVRWIDADGKWTRESDDRTLTFKPSSGDGWDRASGVVKVPEGVATLQIQAGVRDQETDADTAWFDNTLLIRIE